MVETHVLLLYRVVAYVRVLGGQQVYIYFHKIRAMTLRLQTKDAHTLTVHESIFTGCLQSDPAYLYVLRSAITCSTRILPISITLPEILDNFRTVALIQIVEHHSNLCNVLSNTHQKQLECGCNESAGVPNSTVPVVPLPVCISARDTIYSTHCHGKLSPNTLPGTPVLIHWPGKKMV